MASQLEQEIARRRTFAIISHPDAGKTTLTEKTAPLRRRDSPRRQREGQARPSPRHQRLDGAGKRARNLRHLVGAPVPVSRARREPARHTPGHQDFSEDTYRTLAAADAAVMLIDAAKGVEPQTKKLFKVCRMRGIPIFTFVNKLDRYGRAPLELMDELEQVLGIRAYPMNWPVGSGPEFRGVFARNSRMLHAFASNETHGETEVEERVIKLEEAVSSGFMSQDESDTLMGDIDLLNGGGDEFSREKVDVGQLSPMFFGSAMTNFGVRPFLDAFLELTPPPAGRPSTAGFISPMREGFSGFIFKIQANMDPAHRDRIAFMRIVSGKYEKGMTAFHMRLGKDVKLAKPSQFMAAERTAIEDAWPGDVIGLFDPGQYRIGDTLVAGGQFDFEGVPRFSPEHFAIIRTKDPLRRKQMEKGLEQLSEEGTIQIFQQPHMGMKDPIVGVVGALQFEVLQFADGARVRRQHSRRQTQLLARAVGGGRV